MTGLPKLPACGQPATIRTEVYSPGDSLYGSLDWTLHTCAEHAAPVTEAITAAAEFPTLAAWAADEAAAFKFLTDVQRRLAELAERPAELAHCDAAAGGEPADEAEALAIARVRAGRRGDTR